MTTVWGEIASTARIHSCPILKTFWIGMTKIAVKLFFPTYSVDPKINLKQKNRLPILVAYCNYIKI